MKKYFLTLALAASTGIATAEPLKTASLSTVVKDVKVSKSSAAAVPASTGQTVSGSTTVLTGRDSRAELIFTDKTVTRIGANSVFRFGKSSRDLEIEKGSFLLHVPKNAGGAKIRTATVTAAITGTTIMVESGPGWVKFIVIEGEMVLTNAKGETVVVKAGEMIVMDPNAEKFPAKVTVNLKKLLDTSNLMKVETFGPLDPDAIKQISEAVSQQMEERRKGGLLPSNVIVRGPYAPLGNPAGDGKNGNKSIIAIVGGKTTYNPNQPTGPGPGPSPGPGPGPPPFP